MTSQDQVNQLIRRHTTLKNDRVYWEAELWSPAMDFCQPQAGSMQSNNTRQSGELRGQKVYDGTPEWACDVLVNGMYSGLTPDNYKWFKWSVTPEWLNDDPQVKSYLQQCEEITYQALSESNYSESTLGVYRQQAVYGTGCKYIEYDPQKILNFQRIRLTNVCIAEDRSGKIDTIFREFKWSARNAVKQWGNRCPTIIRNAVESGNHDTEFDFLHVVYPREDYIHGKRDRQNMPFASLWLYQAEKKILDEGGYLSFPFSVPRWDREDDVPWGRGPAIKALQDMGVLNQQGKTNLIAAHKMVEPPLAIPEDGFNKAIDLSPGGFNYYNPTRGEIRPIMSSINLPFAVDMQDRTQKAVERRFFVDVFLMLTENPKMTATEVLERKQEKLVILGPTIGQQRREHLDNDLDRVFEILNENGHFPDPPEILLQYGNKIKTEYVSPLAMAQRRIEVESTMRVYQVAGNIVQLTGRTDAIDVLNDEETIRLIADRESAPVEIMKTREQVQAEREAKQQQMEDMQAMQEAAAMTQGAKDLGGIKTDQPNVLTDVAKGLTGE